MITVPPRRLIAAVARKTRIKQARVRDVLVAAFEEIKAGVIEGPVMLRGFGTFHLARRKGCVRPSPADVDKIIEVPATQRLALRSNAERLE